MHFGCCGKENCSGTHTQLRESGGCSRGERLLVEPVSISSSCLVSVGLLWQAGERGALSKEQRAPRHLRRARSSPRGKQDEPGGSVSPSGEGELLTSLKFRNAEQSQLLWTSLGAGDDQALKFPVCMWGPWHVVLETVAFPHLTAPAWLTSDKHALNAFSLWGGRWWWWWFFHKWSPKQFTSFGHSGSAHWGKLPL